MLSTEVIEIINKPSQCNTVPAGDVSTELFARMKDGFVYFNAARYPQIKQVSISQANGEYRCVAQSRNGGNLYLLRQNLAKLADEIYEELLQSVEAAGGQCQMTQDILHIDVPAGYQIVLTLHDTTCQTVRIVPVID